MPVKSLKFSLTLMSLCYTGKTRKLLTLSILEHSCNIYLIVKYRTKRVCSFVQHKPNPSISHKVMFVYIVLRASKPYTKIIKPYYKAIPYTVKLLYSPRSKNCPIDVASRI